MLAFDAGLGHEQARFTRRLPSRKSVVAAAHSTTAPAMADLHPAGNDRQASASCLDGVRAPSGHGRAGLGGGGAARGST